MRRKISPKLFKNKKKEFGSLGELASLSFGLGNLLQVVARMIRLLGPLASKVTRSVSLVDPSDYFW